MNRYSVLQTKTVLFSFVSALFLSGLPVGTVPVAYAADNLFFDGFGGGPNNDSTFNEPPKWTEWADGAIKISGGNTSPQGGRYARIEGDHGSICTKVNAIGYVNLMLSYYWVGDNNAEYSDRGFIEIKPASGHHCTDTNGWHRIKTHHLNSWPTWNFQTPFNIPATYNDTQFLLRFRVFSTNSDEDFRIDGVTVTGDLPSPNCDFTLNPGDNIQAAINAASAGDVICLNPGHYPQTSRIEVTKPVTITRTDCNPDVIEARTPGDISTEAIVDGQGSVDRVFYLLDDDITLQCLEIKDGTGDMVYATSGAETENIVIKNNIIHGASGDEGVQLKWSPNALIQYNDVYDTYGDGLNVADGSDGSQILNNRVHDISSSNAAIYVYGNENVTIQGNLVYDVHNDDGIKMGSKNGSDAFGSGGSILDNVIVDTAQDAITVYMSNVTVQGNKMTDSNSDNGAIYVSYNVDNVHVSQNLIKHNDAYGIRIGKSSLYPSNVTVNNNCIEGNAGGGLIFNYSSGPDLDAENNWWGADNGPSGFGSGSGDTVSDHVDFDPFLTACSLDDIIDQNNDGIPDGADDPLDTGTIVSSLGGHPGGNNFRYRRQQLVKRLNNLGNPNYVDTPTAPSSFGGPSGFVGDESLEWWQLNAVCYLHDKLDELLANYVVDYIAQNFAGMYGVSEEFIKNIILNGAYCDSVYEARADELRAQEEAIALKEEQKRAEFAAFMEKYKPEEVVFAVDADGYPVSSDIVWNACIRNYQVYLPGESKPVNCRRYHTGHTWTHPDTLETFNWYDRHGARNIAIRGIGRVVARQVVDAPQLFAQDSEIRVIRGGLLAKNYILPVTQYIAQKGRNVYAQLLAKSTETTPDQETTVLSEQTVLSE